MWSSMDSTHKQSIHAEMSAGLSRFHLWTGVRTQSSADGWRLTLGLTSLVTVLDAVEGRVDAVAGRLVPAAGAGALGTGAFLLRGAGALAAEVGVERLGAAVALEAELGRGLAELGLVAPATGCMDGQQTQQMDGKR